MSKVKSLITADVQAQLKPIEPPLDFMASLFKLAQPFNKPDMPSDPVERMRAKFVVNADGAIKAIREGADKGKWFRKLADGYFVVSFCNANSALSLNGTTHFQVADVEHAVALLKVAIAGAMAGELDTALKATQRKPPVRKAKEVTPAA